MLLYLSETNVFFPGPAAYILLSFTSNTGKLNHASALALLLRQVRGGKIEEREIGDKDAVKLSNKFFHRFCTDFFKRRKSVSVPKDKME